MESKLGGSRTSPLDGNVVKSIDRYTVAGLTDPEHGGGHGSKCLVDERLDELRELGWVYGLEETEMSSRDPDEEGVVMVVELDSSEHCAIATDSDHDRLVEDELAIGEEAMKFLLESAGLCSRLGNVGYG